MPNPLPNRSQRPRHHQKEKEALQYNRNLLQIIPVDIQARYTRDDGTRRRKQHPIPLPPSPNDSKPPVLPQPLLPMLTQIDQREDYARREGHAKGYARLAAPANAVDGHVARGCVDPGAVGVVDGLVLVEDEVAV